MCHHHPRLLVVLDILDRENYAVRMTIGGVVMKEFLGGNTKERVLHLVSIYESLMRKRVPNVDTLDSYNVNVDYPHVFLSPVGAGALPDSGPEAFSAVVCVLEALK